MDKASVISNLRMGIAAGSVVLSGAVNEAKAIETADNAHLTTSTYAMSGSASITPIEKNVFLADMDSATAQKVLNLTFDKGNLYYLSDNAALEMEKEKQAKKKIRQDKRESRKMHRKNGDKTVYREFLISSPNKNIIFGEFDADSKAVIVNKITYDKEELKKLDKEKQKQVEDRLEFFNSPQYLKNIETHENQHRKSDKTGVDDYGVDFEQHIKLEHHNEIASNTAQLIQYRQAYQDAAKNDKNAKIEDYVISSEFQFYIDAVNKGEINPIADDKASRDKDYAFIANGTQDMWMENKSVPYQSNIDDKTTCWAYSGASSMMQKDDTKYNQIRDNLYNFEIDGKKLNLSPYLKKDLELSPYMQDKANTHQQDYAPFDKKFADYVDKNIKSPQDLQKAQEQAKKILELRETTKAQAEGHFNNSNVQTKSNSTFVATPNMFKSGR